VFALTLDAAKNAAVVVVVVFLIGSLASVWIMKTIIQKLATAAVLLLLAFSAYSQRTSLQDCADKVQGNFETEETSVTVTDTECSFFGTTVTIRDPRNE
jgi:predicted aspartyl protease